MLHCLKSGKCHHTHLNSICKNPLSPQISILFPLLGLASPIINYRQSICISHIFLAGKKNSISSLQQESSPSNTPSSGKPLSVTVTCIVSLRGTGVPKGMRLQHALPNREPYSTQVYTLHYKNKY